MQQRQFIHNFNQLNMFRAIVSAIFRSDAAAYQPAASSVFLYQKLLKTQSSVPEDGRNYRPKHVELIEIINKLSLLHPVGYLYYIISHPSLLHYIRCIQK